MLSARKKQKQLNDELVDICLSHPTDLTRVNQLIDFGAAVNARSSKGTTPLMNAAQFGAFPLVDVLLKRGATVDALDHKGKTALMVAVQRGRQENAVALLNQGTDPNLMSVVGLTALHEAAWRQDPVMVKLLVARGARLDEGAHRGWTPLHAASVGVLSEKSGAIALIELGANVHLVNKNGRTALGDAIQAQSFPTVMALIAHGARTQDPELDGHPELYGLPPLHAAARGGFTGRLLHLLAMGADPDIEHRGRTALDEAEKADEEETAGALQAWQARRAIEGLMNGRKMNTKQKNTMGSTP